MELERRTIVYKFYFLQLTLLPLFIVTQENILSLQVWVYNLALTQQSQGFAYFNDKIKKKLRIFGHGLV